MVAAERWAAHLSLQTRLYLVWSQYRLTWLV